jgi:hypothetical protein
MRLRTPPGNAIEDCCRVPGTLLFHNKKAGANGPCDGVLQGGA